MPLEMTVQNPSEKSEGSMLAHGLIDKSQEEKESPPTMDVVGMVAYTDGSCRPSSSGFMGWGLHGYTYREVQPDQKPMARDHFVTDYGYLKKNQLHYKFGGVVAKHVVPVEYLDFLGSNLNRGTNNQAEIEAIARALSFALKNNIPNLQIFTDSQYGLEGITKWCYGWERRDWITAAGEPVANRRNWEAAFALYKEYKAKFKISVHWVRGHNDNMGNTQADILAGIASNYSLNQVFHEAENVTPEKQRWKTEIDRHPFLSFKRIYFNSNEKFNTPGVYFHADTGAADHLIGKRIPETGLAIIRLNTPEKIVEEVKAKQYSVAQDLNSIMMMKLDRLYDKDIYNHLNAHGRHALIPGKNNINVNWFDRKPVSIEVSGTGLSMRAIECFNHLEELLAKFEVVKADGFKKADDYLTNLNPVNVHDITDTFYTYAEVQVRKDKVMKATLNATFEVGFKDMSVIIEEPYEGALKKLKIPLILGTDLLPRNNLKKLEPNSPKVYMVTWREGEKSLRYATVIETDEGVGIWSNFFADRVFFI